MQTVCVVVFAIIVVVASVYIIIIIIVIVASVINIVNVAVVVSIIILFIINTILDIINSVVLIVQSDNFFFFGFARSFSVDLCINFFLSCHSFLLTNHIPLLLGNNCFFVSAIPTTNTTCFGFFCWWRFQYLLNKINILNNLG